MSRHPPRSLGALSGRARAATVAVEGLVGVGAVLGGYHLLADAEGFGVKESWLQGSPFPDYRIPGLFLLIVIGGGMVAAAVITARGSRLAAFAALLMGGTLLSWLVIETAVVGFRGWQQVPLLAVCGLAGVVLVEIGASRLWRGGGGPERPRCRS